MLRSGSPKRGKKNKEPKVHKTEAEKKKHKSETRQKNRKRKRAASSAIEATEINLDPALAQVHVIDKEKLDDFFNFFKMGERKEFPDYDKPLIHAIGNLGPYVSISFLPFNTYID